MICDEGLEHSQANSIVDHALDEPGPLAWRHDGALEGQKSREYPLQAGALLGQLQPGDLFKVDLIEQAGPVERHQVLSAAGALAFSSLGLDNSIS